VTEPTTGTHAAKRPLTPIAGPYGHPFHPLLVTVPIGAFISSLVFDIGTRVEAPHGSALVYGSYWLIAIGIVGALVAAVFGLLDLLTIPRNTTAFRTGLTHLGINLVVVVLYVLNLLWRQDDWDIAKKVRAAQIILSVVALALLAVSGWLGGRLTYRYGVRVATEDDQARAFVTTTPSTPTAEAPPAS
jgi:uncharacterized membrane protein